MGTCFIAGAHVVSKQIKEYRKGIYATLLTQCQLNACLHDIDVTATGQVRLTTAQLVAEKVVMSEVIYLKKQNLPEQEGQARTILRLLALIQNFDPATVSL